MAKINRVVKGERPTLLEASKANELIDKINALQNVTIQPGNQDIVYVTDQGVDIYYKGTPGTTPPPSSTFQGSGVFDVLQVLNFNGLESSIVQIEDGIVTEVEHGDVALGTNFSLQLLDPTNPQRIIELLIVNGLVASVTTKDSNYRWTNVSVCVDGVNTNRRFLTQSGEAGELLTQQNLLTGDVLAQFYTKQETDTLYTRKSDSYTKAQSDLKFITEQDFDDFITAFESALL